MNDLLNGIDIDVINDAGAEQAGFGNVLDELVEDGKPCLLRLISYIEKGIHPKKNSVSGENVDTNLADLAFEVVTPRYTKQDDDGNYITGVIRVPNLKISNHEKSTYNKFFKAMNYNQKYKSFAQMLGNYFLCSRIDVNESGEGKKKRKYFNINSPSDGARVGAPVVTDPETGDVRPIKIKFAGVKELQLFLWDQPTTTCWDSIYIDGVKDNGESKNFIQNTIMEAQNFVGSPIEAFLLENGTELVPDENVEPEPSEEDSEYTEPDDLDEWDDDDDEDDLPPPPPKKPKKKKLKTAGKA